MDSQLSQIVKHNKLLHFHKKTLSAVCAAVTMIGKNKKRGQGGVPVLWWTYSKIINTG